MKKNTIPIPTTASAAEKKDHRNPIRLSVCGGDAAEIAKKIPEEAVTDSRSVCDSTSGICEHRNEGQDDEKSAGD
jgi:hypothetical protein